ncbi:MAG: hypothetical protein WCF65_01215 [Parachlamydiaceae bacterium]
MQKIAESLERFTESLEKQQPISCNKGQLTWTTLSPFRQKLQSIANLFFDCKNKHTLEVGKTFCRFLDHVEIKPIIFGAEAREMTNQKAYFASCLKAAKVVKHLLKSSNSPQCQDQLHHLARRVSGLKYRIGVENEGLDRASIDPTLETKLLTLAQSWKNDQPLYIDKALTARDKEKIAELCSYPHCANLLLTNKGFRKSFFVWAIRDNGGVSQFVEYPATAERIKSSFIASRVGRLGKDLLCIQKRDRDSIPNGAQEKVMTLPFCTGAKVERVSILDDTKEIEMYGGWRLSIKKIFEVFANKNHHIGDLEFFGSTGINVWNSHELGRWNEAKQTYDGIDLSTEEWWKELPILEEVTKDQLEARYQITLEPGQWLVCGKATRQTPDLDIAGQHGFMEMAVPTEDGLYRTFPFANFPNVFPSTVFQLMTFLGNTLPSKVAYPDENVFYSQRQTAAHPIPLSPNDGARVMSKVRDEAIKARAGSTIFQFAGENCAFWAQKVINVIKDNNPVPNLFRMKLIMASPNEPLLRNIFATIRKAPTWLHSFLLKGLDIIFGSWRGITIIENGKKVHKSHIKNEHRQSSEYFQPGYLHEQIIQGKIKGVITYGH